MKLEVFRSLWGWEGDWNTCVEQLREVGCVGIESRLPYEASAQNALRQRLSDAQLAYIAVVFTGGDVVPKQDWTLQQHWDRLQASIDGAQHVGARFLNVLPGNDRWPLAKQVEFFGRAQEMADASGALCSFEIHRATSLYSPWVALQVIEQLPQLRFTCDLSHWVVVCERLLNDPVDDLRPFIERVHHIQARVGYDQGPQVPHPDAPEYGDAVRFHQNVWERIWAAQQARGYGVTTLTPEFGPDGYTHKLPFTQMPIADLWSLNSGMARTEMDHFAQWQAAHI